MPQFSSRAAKKSIVGSTGVPPRVRSPRFGRADASRLIGVDAGWNPEIKAVRTPAAAWLADESAAVGLIGPQGQ